MGVATEGNMFVGGSKGTGRPYPIPYRAITPQADECRNLLVPVCFSASYIAYASAHGVGLPRARRSAGVAAAQAIRENAPVQAIDAAKLRSRLLERGQVLEWTEEMARRVVKSGVETGEWSSLEEWSESKRGWEWLFPFIDRDKDGKISAPEHTQFQEYKKQHPDWQKRVRGELGGK